MTHEQIREILFKQSDSGIGEKNDYFDKYSVLDAMFEVAEICENRNGARWKNLKEEKPPLNKEVLFVGEYPVYGTLIQNAGVFLVKIFDTSGEEQLESLLEFEFWLDEEVTQKLKCNQCGGELVFIRGRYPGTHRRCVCPTCTTERLEQINEISDKNYGQAKSSDD